MNELYDKALKANVARTEIAGDVNTRWTPDAIKIKKEKDKKEPSNTLSNDDKIMYLESATRRYFVPYQWVDDGVLEYFQMLRRGENIEFLNNLHTVKDLYDYSYTIRDTLMQPKNQK